MSFEIFNLHPDIMAGVKAQGYTTPTPIQLKSIPPIMQGRDVIGLAQTGTGKTAAFVLPVLHRLMYYPKGQVSALIISPTRELAEQTNETINELGQKSGLHSISIYGGVSMEQQTRGLRRGVELVVACPGRLLDHLLKGNLDLSRLEALIIDEADRMFDMGFLPDIRNIVRCITKPHQTLLFSATMPNDIKRLVQEVLTDPLTVQIGQSAPVASVSHALFPVQPHLKTALLKEILRTTETESVVIFTKTKHKVERVADQLMRAGYKVAALQGDMNQYRRQEALDGFRDGSLKILVATDIAARGLDILSISHVINYDMPDTTDAYTHRIGRAGRINNTGEAFTLVTGEDKDMIKALERIFKKPIETRKVEGFNYSSEAPAASRSARHPGVSHVRRVSRKKPELSTGRQGSQYLIQKNRSNNEKSTKRHPAGKAQQSAHYNNSTQQDRPLSRERVSSG
jgi:ATP-dependent RNA helicase RhlE